MNVKFGQSYTFTVRAVTIYGTGESASVRFNVEPFFAQVQHLTGTLSGQNILLKWEAPGDLNKQDIKVRMKATD